MANATDPRGCPGSWQLYDNWSGHPTFSGLDTYSGFELDDPTWTLAPGSSTTWQLICVGTDSRSLASASINDPSSTLYSSSKTFVKDDSSCTTPAPVTPYDCINGACIKKSVYNTPGLYQSLSDCEVVCGIGCSGKCISNSDWSQIEGLSHQLKNRNCG
ncbi:hypothetical protein [Nostoc sp.]|uniref:hypothetical protein n=1 Tax=Nostoc sp. TaxID=1180 RepID=UPI002FFAB2DA